MSRSTAPRPDALSIRIDLVAGRVTLTGDLDRGSAHHLSDAVAALVPTPHLRWELDARGVTWCDAGGLRALLAASALATALDRRLAVVAASRCVARLLALVDPPPVPPVRPAPLRPARAELVRPGTPERCATPA